MKKLLLLICTIACIYNLTSLVHAQNIDSGNGAGTTTQKGVVVQIGDSLTTGMYGAGAIVDKYKTAGWTPVVPGANPSGDGSCLNGFVAGYPCHALAAGVSPTGLEAIDANQESIKQASVVVFEMGTNAIESDDAYRNGIAQAATKVRTFNPNTKIYWVNLVALPVTNGQRTSANIAGYSKRNKIIQEVAAANNITVIDWFHKVFPTGDPTNISDQLTDTQNYYPIGGDGIHLTGIGYEAMADFIVTSITSGVSSPGTTQTTNKDIYLSDCIAVKVGNPTGTPPPCDQIQVETISTSGNSTHPTAPEVPDRNYIKAIQDKFGIVVGSGFNPPNENYNPYKVIWEKLWDVSNTHFIDYLKIANAQIMPINGGSVTTSCTANIRSTVEDAELFRVIFIHELGHVIRNCVPTDITHKADAINVLATEGGLTMYSDNPNCAYAGYSSDGVRQDEDYAEMTTFYLNPGVTDRTNCTQGIIPFANNAHPLHYTLAQKIYGAY